MHKLLKQVLLISIVVFCYHTGSGQDCSCLTKTKDKRQGTKSYSTLITSKEYRCAYVYKDINVKDTLVKPKYTLALFVPSKVSFTESMLKTFGTMYLKFRDSTVLAIDSIKYYNGPGLDFKANLTEQQIKIIAIKPLVNIKILNIVLTFDDEKLEEWKCAFNCLLISK